MSAAATDTPAELSRQRRLEAVCDRFEAAWKAGSPPRLVDFLDGAGPPERAEWLAELIALDDHYRRKAGEFPTPAHYLAACPDDAEVVGAYFAELAQTVSRPANADPLLPAVPGFVIERELGRGGMGVVYLARQERPRRRVVLKLIRDAALAHSGARRRFQTEADAIARLQHPNIVEVYAVGESDGRPYIVLEYVAGGSLDRAVAGRPINPALAAHLTEQLARAVQNAHGLGVIHRDLKPANVLLRFADEESASAESQVTASGRVSIRGLEAATPKVSDFGLAKLLQGEPNESVPTMTGETLGTPSYMAPEQARGQVSAIGPATDIYALGAILYELLTGRPPFVGATPISTLEQVTRMDPVPPRQLSHRLPRDLETVCLKCLEKSPERRYGSAGELAEDLRRFRLGEPIRARPVGTAERAWRWARRHPTAAVLIGSLAALLVNATAALIMLNAARQSEHAAQQRARDAIDRSLVHLAADEDMVRRGLYDLRGRLLDDVITLVEEYRDDGHEPKLTENLAKAYSDLANVRYYLGRFPEARAASDRGVELCESLPDGVGRQTFCRCLNQRADWSILSAQRESAERDLRRAQSLLRGASADEARDPAVFVLQAENDLRLAEVSDGGGRRALMRQAESTVNRALALAPGDIMARRTQAVVLQRLATYAYRETENREDEELSLRAVRQLQALADEFPAYLEVQYELGRAYTNMADVYMRENRPTDAEPHARRALAVCRRVTADSPAVLPFQGLRMLGHANLAEILEAMGEDAAALAEWQHARAAAEGHVLPAKHLGPHRINCMTVNMLRAYANAMTARGQFDDALRSLDLADSVLPTDADPRNCYGRGHNALARANCLDRRGDYAGALAWCQRATGLEASTPADSRRVFESLARASLGEAEAAAAAATEVAQSDTIESTDLYDLARVFARCCRRAPIDTKRDTWSARALDCLRRAAERGHFSGAGRRRALSVEPDLDPLRGRPDFVVFVASLAAR